MNMSFAALAVRKDAHAHRQPDQHEDGWLRTLATSDRATPATADEDAEVGMISEKSLSAAQRMLEACASDVASQSVTPMQLLKLVYIAHGYMLGRHGRPLLQEDVQAWQYGPVVPSVYHAVKGFNSSPVDQVPGAGRATLSTDEQAVIEEVARVYGRHHGIALSAATHCPGTPWSKTWERWGRNAAISNDLIESFYSDLLKQERHSSL